MANSPTDPARDLLAWALEAGEDAIAATLGARAVKATRPTTAERLAALRVCAQLASDAAIDDDMAEAEATARAHRAVTAETDAATDQRAHGWAELLANHTARARKAFARAAEIGADTRVGARRSGSPHVPPTLRRAASRAR